MSKLKRPKQPPKEKSMCECGEEFDVISESPRSAMMQCINKKCNNFGRAAIGPNLRYLELLNRTERTT